MEKGLSVGDWRRFLLGFLESYAGEMDGWVHATMRQGNHLEALRVEEWRRCRSELHYLADTGSDVFSAAMNSLGAEVTAQGLVDMVKQADSSFVILIKCGSRSLVTWVLSGETGELVCSDEKDFGEEEITAHDINSWLASVNFVHWSKLLQAFSQARSRIKKKKDSGKLG